MSSSEYRRLVVYKSTPPLRAGFVYVEPGTCSELLITQPLANLHLKLRKPMLN